tara:strand:+ start:620 stop:1264 length:645 start_codon:yes stop_codon:yes gene_type:complete
MSTTEEVLSEVSTFFEDTTKTTNTNGEVKRAGLVEGEYLGHIVNARSIVRPVLGKFQARIYNFDVIVADENRGMTYQYEDITGKHIEISGEQFVDKKLMAKGVFKFLDPQDGDTFEGNPTENRKYLLFCETLGVHAEEETRTIDGKETTVKLLPTLTEEQMLGRPVTAVLKKVKDKWVNNKGETMHYSWRVSFVKPWTQGSVKTMEVNKDDLPF